MVIGTQVKHVGSLRKLYMTPVLLAGVFLMEVRDVEFGPKPSVSMFLAFGRQSLIGMAMDTGWIFLGQTERLGAMNQFGTQHQVT